MSNKAIVGSGTRTINGRPVCRECEKRPVESSGRAPDGSTRLRAVCGRCRWDKKKQAQEFAQSLADAALKEAQTRATGAEAALTACEEMLDLREEALNAAEKALKEAAEAKEGMRARLHALEDEVTQAQQIVAGITEQAKEVVGRCQQITERAMKTEADLIQRLHAIQEQQQADVERLATLTTLADGWKTRFREVQRRLEQEQKLSTERFTEAMRWREAAETYQCKLEMAEDAASEREGMCQIDIARLRQENMRLRRNTGIASAASFVILCVCIALFLMGV